MNEVLNSGALSLASLAVSVVILVVGLVLWFFVNRARSIVRSAKKTERIAPSPLRS